MRLLDRMLLESPKRTAVKFFVAGIVFGVIGAVSMSVRLFSTQVPLRHSLYLVCISSFACAFLFWVPALVMLLFHLCTRDLPKTRYPFQSDEVREICSHMSEEEERSIYRMGSWAGIQAGVVVVLLYLAVEYPSLITATIAVAALAVLVALGPLSRRRVRRFYCSTQWARDHGYKPESLRLYRFRPRRTHVNGTAETAAPDSQHSTTEEP